MTSLTYSYSLRNLIQNQEYLLNLTKSLGLEISQLEKTNEEVKQKQIAAQKRGQSVKNVASQMSCELAKVELTDQIDGSLSDNQDLKENIKKLTKTESKLRELRSKLDEFVGENDEETFQKANFFQSTKSKELEGFFQESTNLLNEKIGVFEKITNRIKAEKRELLQQKLLLKELVDLFNDEIIELEKTFKEIKSQPQFPNVS